ncbi:hypothetical protein [Peribacillus frigoritolerans]|uniref:hypothetical protein n=1 Tax=Peribacillus frigoritolerans TaxID=450367 RepID=UPI0020BF7506|nr:hypothetical protein [Peribacillus frigoritolerans]
MILRHLTTKELFEKILKDGFLKGSENLRPTHKGHVSFELYNPEKDPLAFIRAFSKAKGIPETSVVELLFDGTKMIENGIEVRETFINGVKDKKIELGYYVDETELESIGDYRFVFGNVSLEFLIDAPKTL